MRRNCCIATAVVDADADAAAVMVVGFEKWSGNWEHSCVGHRFLAPSAVVIGWVCVSVWVCVCGCGRGSVGVLWVWEKG